MAVLKMAQQSETTNTTNNVNINSTSTYLQENEVLQVKPKTFHDFLGMKATDSAFVLAPKATDARFSEASPSASASFAGASSGGAGSGCAGRAPISSTSDLGSERQVGNHLEGIPYYGPRSEIYGLEISKRLIGTKRSNSDSTFMGHESLESLHLMKKLHNGARVERPRGSNEDEMFLAMQPMRPSSASLLLQPPTGSRLEGNASKCELSVPLIGSPVQYAARGAHFAPFVHPESSNMFKDTKVGPSVISQAAADEGSRTGFRSHGILSFNNGSGVPTEKTISGVMQSRGRPKFGAHFLDPESSVPPCRQRSTSTSRQMTIFYDGQAHVFDDVHPNKLHDIIHRIAKETRFQISVLLDEIMSRTRGPLSLTTSIIQQKADVIMALAGSNGGSWSTTCSPKSSAVRPVSENDAPSGEPEAAGRMSSSREFRGRIVVAAANTSQGTGSGERISIHTGVPRLIVKDTKNTVQAAEPGTEDKREV